MYHAPCSTVPHSLKAIPRSFPPFCTPSGSMMDTVPYDRYLHIEFTHGANDLAHVVVRRDVVCAVSARASRHRRLPRPGHAAALEATTVHCLRTRN